ncbi:hypothetical protein [Pseudomonas poae]|uniref:hypothetical protein n=1 Tax=Pseudomonas poae TaxID=200451 RepID=UPI0016440B50|nr:hypothetical protein [Pseudomonas poae]MBC3196996.1 hypothetical protein [Pseudomonas poae]
MMQASLRSCDLYDLMAESNGVFQDVRRSVSDFFVTDNLDTALLADLGRITTSVVSTDVYTENIEIFAQEVNEDIVAKQIISIEGWHLALAALSILGGAYYFAWDSHKALLSEVSGLRSDMRQDKNSADDDLKKLISELRAEREADRQQAKVDNEAMRDTLGGIREAQGRTIEALNNLKK